MKRIIECVPNFSEGRDLDKIEKIINPFRGKKDVKLLDYQRDEDHNRLVVTVIGDPDALKHTVIEAMGVAIDLIDMRKHKGQHPRMGAIDVVPFVPVKDITMAEVIDFSKDVAKEVAGKYALPIFLYEKAATVAERQNLAVIRKGEFEKMAEKIKIPEWKPDYGPGQIHPSAGVTAIGARMPLVAYNVNLGTDDIKIAHDKEKSVRH
ncbi:MAG: glutamate formimidoyltransferase, partial [Deltaproteobacteria bacterium]|nr:glutamate formimidoyltransferase [Deltaproteobacteria bacterium]